MRKVLIATVGCLAVGCMLSAGAFAKENGGIEGIRAPGEMLGKVESEITSSLNGIMGETEKAVMSGKNLISDANSLVDKLEKVTHEGDIPEWVKAYYGADDNGAYDSLKDEISKLAGKDGMASGNAIAQAGAAIQTAQSATGLIDTVSILMETDPDNWSIEDIQDALDYASGAKKGFEYMQKQSALMNKMASLSQSGALEAVTDMERTLSDFSEMKHNGLGVAGFSEAGKAIMQDSLTKVQDFVSGKELTRLVNAEVLNAMADQADVTPAEGLGVPTIDIANMTIGLLNLDSVFEIYHGNDSVRITDYMTCGISGEKWKECCKDAAAEAASGSEMADIEKACCEASPTKCFDTEADYKADCLKKASSLKEGWVTCAIECGNKTYGELVHNEDEKYSDSQIEDLVKECYSGNDDYTPSPTVLTSSELAAVVPETVKEILQ